MTTITSKDGRLSGTISGEIDGGCVLEGCFGSLLLIQWDDGQVTEICEAETVLLEDGKRKIDAKGRNR